MKWKRMISSLVAELLTFAVIIHGPAHAETSHAVEVPMSGYAILLTTPGLGSKTRSIISDAMSKSTGNTIVELPVDDAIRLMDWMASSHLDGLKPTKYIVGKNSCPEHGWDHGCLSLSTGDDAFLLKEKDSRYQSPASKNVGFFAVHRDNTSDSFLAVGH